MIDSAGDHFCAIALGKVFIDNLTSIEYSA